MSPNVSSGKAEKPCARQGEWRDGKKSLGEKRGRRAEERETQWEAGAPLAPKVGGGFERKNIFSC